METVGGDQTLPSPPGTEVVANITDTYFLAPLAPGELTVTKTIAGPAAGQQGAITISVSCGGDRPTGVRHPGRGSSRHANRAATRVSPPATTCTVTETGNGASGTMHVVTEGSPQTVDISANGTGIANVVDTYSNTPIPTGSFTVTKNITGAAAGQQGPVTVTASCNGQALSPTLDIPAGATGVQSQTYPGIPAGSVCSATAGPDGGTSSVQVTITGDGGSASVPAGGVGTVDITDTYTSLAGSLVVTKTIAGPAAGQQGRVAVRTVCNGSPLSPELTVPAGAAAGIYSKTYGAIPAGAACTVHEVANGSTATVSVTTIGAGQTVTVPGAHVAEAGITDTYGPAAGSLRVAKTIAGPAAGKQGAVTVQAVCNGSPLSPALRVPAGAPAGTHSHTYHHITAGSACEVTETAAGSNQSVAVKVTGDGQHVTVLAGSTATAALKDTYSHAAGSLVVAKTIAGHAAGHQGSVRIQVVCDGIRLTPEFKLPAGAAAGTTSHTYDEIPAGSTCTVSELTNGGTNALSVTTEGATQHVTVPAGQTVEADVTNTYEFAPGSLTVTKTIAGPAASQQAAINILVDCGADNVFGLRIPEGAPAGPVPETFHGIPGGSTCTVVETNDGHDKTIDVERTGDGQKVKVPAGEKATAHLTDSFTAAAMVTTTTTTTTTTTVPATTTTTVPHAHNDDDSPRHHNQVPSTTTTVPSTTTTTKPQYPR